MRRTKLTPALIEAMGEAISIPGQFAEPVATAAGVHRVTFQRWIREGHEARALVQEHTSDTGSIRRGFKLTAYQQLVLSFLEKIEEADAKAEIETVKELRQIIREKGDAATLLKYLSLRHGKRWASGATLTLDGFSPDAEKGLTVNLAFALPATVEREEAEA